MSILSKLRTLLFGKPVVYRYGAWLKQKDKKPFVLPCDSCEEAYYIASWERATGHAEKAAVVVRCADGTWPEVNVDDDEPEFPNAMGGTPPMWA